MSIESHFRAKPEFDLPLNQTALVIVDMQRGGLLADVGMGPDNAKRNPEGFQSYQKYVNETLIPNNERLLERARALGMRVIFLTSGAFWADQADLNGPRRRKDLQRQRQTGVKTLFSIGEYEHGIIDQLAPVGDEPVLNKVGASGFAGTGMDQMLRWLGISTVIFTGIGTPACVESTVRQGADLGYACVVASDACGTLDLKLHEQSLEAMGRLFAMIRTTDEVLALLPEPKLKEAAGS